MKTLVSVSPYAMLAVHLADIKPNIVLIPQRNKGPSEQAH